MSAKCTNLVRESEIEAYLVKRVRELGGITYKFTSPGRNAVPDRIVLLHGRVGFIELKAPGKRPTEAQYAEHARIRLQGCFADWADTKERVDLVLEALAA